MWAVYRIYLKTKTIAQKVDIYVGYEDACAFVKTATIGEYAVIKEE